MKGFVPALFDRLIDDHGQAVPAGVLKRFNIEDLKDSVARDLEALLNTRSVMRNDLHETFPECSRSIMTYGLHDFAGMSLASTDDRKAICEALVLAIDCHEPRLRDVKAALEIEDGSINRLNFAISAMLVLPNLIEPVNFDAVLKPSTLQYSINKARRTTRLAV